MIQLTKLDSSVVLVNPDIIKYVETIPDTLLQFLNGDSLLVCETIQEIAEKCLEVKRILQNQTEIDT